MVKRTRTILFLACFFLFVLIAPSAVFYSQGYRLDFNPPAGGIKITRTGGLFLKIIPRQADIYIDGKSNKRTDFFFGSALIENLLPKKYQVEIKKEGYHSWEKILEIKEKKVTEAKNIVLFPKNINFSSLSGSTDKFWLLPNQRKIILLEKENEENDWSLKLYDLEKKIKSHLITDKDVFVQGAELINLFFSEDSKKIYLKVSLDGKDGSFSSSASLPESEEIKYFILEELDKNKPFLTETESPFLISENIIIEQKYGNDIYYLDNSGHFFKNREQISSLPFAADPKAEYDLKIFQNFIFLKRENNLYKFNPELKAFENFFEGVNSLKISPDNKKLAYSSDYEIWVLFLSDKSDPPQKKAGDKLLLFRLSEKITNLFWINNNYLTFISEDKIKISEIDDRDKLNIADIFEIKKLPQNGSSTEMLWSQYDKKLYLLKDNTLYGSDVLLP